jgi:cell division transport system permease protein
MSKSGKASIKRGKPSYFMSILGVTAVLFLLGLIGYLIIIANKAGDQFKENVLVSVYLKGDLNPKDSAALQDYILSKPYVNKLEYITKDMAEKRFVSENGEDFKKILNENPLPGSIDFTLKKQYVHPDTLSNIKKDLELQTYVTDVQYQEALVGKLTKNIRQISIWLLGFAIIIALVVIVLIDNTIRLAMFSNRFLIKTMQMVGATRWFIAKPMNLKAIVNGAISGITAAGLVWLIVFFAKRNIPDLDKVSDPTSLALLFGGLILLGICITLLSTHRSVLKYLKMKLDDLY